jgi:hypothetical protein
MKILFRFSRTKREQNNQYQTVVPDGKGGFTVVARQPGAGFITSTEEELLTKITGAVINNR